MATEYSLLFDVEHKEYLEAVDLRSYVGTIYPLGLPLASLRDLPLLFVYSQVNTGVLYFLDYVEDIYIMVLSVLVSTLNLNHTGMYLPLLLMCTVLHCTLINYVQRYCLCLFLMSLHDDLG